MSAQTQQAARRVALPQVIASVLGRGRATDSTYRLELDNGVSLEYVDGGDEARVVIHIDKAKVARAEADAKIVQLVATLVAALGGGGRQGYAT